MVVSGAYLQSISNLTLFAIGEDYRNKGSRTLGKGNTNNGMDDGNEPVDEFGRVNKGPFTLRNGATYTGQWLDGQRDGIGT